jgi:hypothetical protein
MPARRAKLDTWLRERTPAEVTLVEFEELLRLLAPVTEPDLRHLLRDSGAKLHPLAAGVNQTSFATLRDSLGALAICYASGTAETKRVARQIVITAKDHAKLAARNQRVALEKRDEKEEMVTWMRTWLENPDVFALWAAMRVRAWKGD